MVLYTPTVDVDTDLQYDMTNNVLGDVASAPEGRTPTGWVITAPGATLTSIDVTGWESTGSGTSGVTLERTESDVSDPIVRVTLAASSEDDSVDLTSRWNTLLGVSDETTPWGAGTLVGTSADKSVTGAFGYVWTSTDTELYRAQFDTPHVAPQLVATYGAGLTARAVAAVSETRAIVVLEHTTPNTGRCAVFEFGTGQVFEFTAGDLAGIADASPVFALQGAEDGEAFVAVAGAFERVAGLDTATAEGDATVTNEQFGMTGTAVSFSFDGARPLLATTNSFGVTDLDQADWGAGPAAVTTAAGNSTHAFGFRATADATGAISRYDWDTEGMEQFDLAAGLVGSDISSVVFIDNHLGTDRFLVQYATGGVITYRLGHFNIDDEFELSEMPMLPDMLATSVGADTVIQSGPGPATVINGLQLLAFGGESVTENRTILRDDGGTPAATVESSSSGMSALLIAIIVILCIGGVVGIVLGGLAAAGKPPFK